ncbi:asparagine synthase (glutamine-hydrolyzing) [Candidatus Parcubacteria bacterium]|nr:MAG: asparagine synthase (glutamine-hydrolyzing) [Candidatus Parcubacteria bacterium]
MCGIAGQFRFDSLPDRSLVEKMAKALIHRGPDSDGFYFSDRVGLGIRRLKIIDLKTGDQPIHNEDKTIWVVFNGEIYNFKELRDLLEKRGHSFYTRSDTETIVHLYEEYKEDFVSYLNGMFAIALWDDKNKKLILARDRVGEKPLYYFHNKKEIIFASEMKALLENKTVSRDINPEALHYYLVLGRVPAPYAIINGIQKLEPAHIVVVNKEGVVGIKKYWELSFKPKANFSEEEAKAKLREKLEESVVSRMVADVPLGAFLSGGVDSSAVVAMMAQNSSKPVETFSVGFDEKDFSELAYASIVAKRFSTNHHEFIIKPDVFKILPKLVWYLDEPFADASIIPTYYVAQATRSHVTAALTGDGGDELFAGYEWYKALKLARLYVAMPKILRGFLSALSSFIPNIDERESSIRYLHKLKRFFETQAKTNKSPLDIFMSMTGGFTEEILHSFIYDKNFSKSIKNISARNLRQEKIDEYDGDDPLEALSFEQFSSLLPDMFFTKVDRCTMSVSLESRAPLVDYKFVEFIAKLPFSYKLRGFKTKYIFKEAMRGILPEEILFRPKKGFAIPLHRWIKEDPLKKEITRVLLDEGFIKLGYFNKSAVSNLVLEHMDGKKNNFEKIWRLYVFALWYKQFCI